MRYILLITTVVMSIFTAACGQAADDGLPDISFLNQSSVGEMHNGLLDAFPPGTAREFVQEALVEKGGATYLGKIKNVHDEPFATNIHQYQYRKPFYLRLGHDGKYLITIYFDEQDRVRSSIKHEWSVESPAVIISGPTGL